MVDEKRTLTRQDWEENHDTLVIDVPTEFNFRSNLGYLQRDENECMYGVQDEIITRVIVVEDVRTLVQIHAPDNHELHVRFLAGTRPHTANKRAAVVNYIRDWFDLDTDLAPFYHMAQHDPLLKEPAKNFYGLRIVGIPDLFEALCWGVLGQQINIRFAYTLKRQFVETFGESVIYNGTSYWVFPSYKTIAQLEPQDMSDIKMTVRKSEYIIGIAKLMANEELAKDQLLELDDFKQIEKRLINIRGIGPWTAHYILMRCLRYPMAFPIDDVGLLNAIKYLQNMDRKPTKQEMIEHASTWQGWEAYATFFYGEFVIKKSNRNQVLLIRSECLKI